MKERVLAREAAIRLGSTVACDTRKRGLGIAARIEIEEEEEEEEMKSAVRVVVMVVLDLKRSDLKTFCWGLRFV